MDARTVDQRRRESRLWLPGLRVRGRIASLIMKTNAQMGLIANIVVGVVGSLIGHWVAGALGIAAAGTLANWIVSLVGAVALITILRAIGVSR